MIENRPCVDVTYVYNSASPFLISGDDPRYAVWTKVRVVSITTDDVWYVIEGHPRTRQTTVARFMEIVHDYNPLQHQ